MIVALSSRSNWSTGLQVETHCRGEGGKMRLVLGKLLLKFDFEAIEEKRLKWEELRTSLIVEKKPIEVRMKLINIGWAQ
jgi:hypothetical protein